MIESPKEKKERQLLEALFYVASHWDKHKINEKCTIPLDLSSLPVNIRQSLVEECRNPYGLIERHWKPVSETVAKIPSGVTPNNNDTEPQIFGLTDRGWEEYRKLMKEYPDIASKPVVINPPKGGKIY